MKASRIILLAALAVGLSSCGLFQEEPKTGLFEKGTHTGTATLLRADIGWHPDPAKRNIRKIGDNVTDDDRKRRFVPLRHKGDLVGLDGPEQIVTETSKVTVSLNSVFIKYFKELGAKKRKGEIAMVISFDGGTTASDSLLIYSSQGQTLGSHLDLDDWPMIGPAEIDGDSLLVRVVIIELDQAENERAKQMIRAIAQAGTTLAPNLGFAASIAQPLADFIISLNNDDVILDHRFGLQRVTKGAMPNRNALLFGKYVLVLQEDKLRDDDVSLVTPRAVLPPLVTDLRYDMHSDRVYKAYNYYPALADGDDEFTCDSPQPGSYQFTYRGNLYEGVGNIDWNQYFPGKDSPTDPFEAESEYRRCLLEAWVNGNAARDIRGLTLGYDNAGKVGDFELWSSLDTALKAAFFEGIRHSSRADQDLSKEEILGALKDADNKYQFNYPATLYPEAFTLMAQYPLHTYIVFSIEESLGTPGQRYDQRFQNYADFLGAELKQAREDDRAGALAAALGQSITAKRLRESAFQKIMALGDDKAAKVCVLYPLLIADDDKALALSNAEIYDKIFNITGKWTDSPATVAALLEGKPYNYSVDEAKQSCAAKPSS